MSSSASPVIILTGASRGLGLAVLRILLSRHDARVTAISRSAPPELLAVAEQYGEGRVMLVKGDVREVDVNADAVSKTVDRFGRLDGLVLNAGGIEPVAKLADVSPSDALPYLETNLLSSLYLIQHALPYLRRPTPSSAQLGPSTTRVDFGRIVFVSSGASSTAYQGWGLYCMAKAGINSLCRSIAAEEREAGVLAWAVRPGLVNTSMQALVRDKGPGVMSPKDMAKFQSAFENGELLPPEQPGAVIAGLAINGTDELTGDYLNWSDERIQRVKEESQRGVERPP